MTKKRLEVLISDMERTLALWSARANREPTRVNWEIVETLKQDLAVRVSELGAK